MEEPLRSGLKIWFDHDSNFHVDLEFDEELIEQYSTSAEAQKIIDTDIFGLWQVLFIFGFNPELQNLVKLELLGKLQNMGLDSLVHRVDSSFTQCSAGQYDDNQAIWEEPGVHNEKY